MVSSINSVLQRATTTSVQEIDTLITELEAIARREKPIANQPIERA